MHCSDLLSCVKDAEKPHSLALLPVMSGRPEALDSEKAMKQVDFLSPCAGAESQW